MKRETFDKLWNQWSDLWLQMPIDNKKIDQLCTFKKGASNTIFKNYQKLKLYVKDFYFKQPIDGEPILNRYKRGAVLVYAILQANPLIILNPTYEEDQNFLKQRLAFFLGIASILMDFNKAEVASKHVFAILESIGKENAEEGNDEFLLSIYKDLFYSELYKNFNILTMANVFGLLVESVVGLTDSIP